MASRLFSTSPVLSYLRDHKLQAAQWVVISGVFIASLYVAYRPFSRWSMLLLAGTVGAGAIIILIRRPSLGLVALVIASLVVPFAIGTGTGTEINIAILLVGFLLVLWLIEMVVIRRQVTIIRSRVMPPLFGLMIAALLAFGMGQLPWFTFAAGASIPTQVGALAVFVLSAGAFLLMAHQVKDLFWLQRISWMFLILGGVYLLNRIFPDIGALTGRYYQRGMDGSMFWVWVVAIAFSQALINRQLHVRWRLALGILVLAALYVGYVLAGDWKSGWIPPLVGVAAIILLRYRHLWPFYALGAVAYIPSLYSQLVATDQYSYVTRLEAWRILWEITKVNPIFGLGPANYYWYTPLFPILGYYVSFNSHNNYVDIIAQIGFLGLFAFLWFAWELWRLGWGLKDRVPEGFARAYVYGALGGLVGTLVAGMLGDWIFDNWIYIPNKPIHRLVIRGISK